MTINQEQHLKEILASAAIMIETKYRKGQQAHGGNLFDLSPSQLIDEAINEAIDQLVYLLTAKANLQRWKDSMQ